MNCRLAGPWNISLNLGYFLFDSELKVRSCAPVWVWAVVLALWEQLKSKFILGCTLSYLSQCRAPGSSCCCKTNQLLQSHFFFGLFLAQGLMAQWSALSCPGEVLHCGSSPLLVGVPGWDPCSKGWVCRWGWDAALVWVFSSLLAVLGGFASSQICSPGGTNPGCCTELWENSYQKCQLCDMCCGTEEFCFHCCLTPCQHNFWKSF